jgi:putative transposase
MSAQRRWQKLRGHELMVKVIQGLKFKDGEEVEEVA